MSGPSSSDTSKASKAETVQARTVFAYCSKTDRVFLDAVMPDPSHPDRFILAISGASGVQHFPLVGSDYTAMQEKTPGTPFSAAILQLVASGLTGMPHFEYGTALTQQEIAEITAPLLRWAALGKTVIAGLLLPTAPDARFIRFTAQHLGHWKFIPGADEARSRQAGGKTFGSIRVFSVEEWDAYSGRTFTASATKTVAHHRPTQEAVRSWLLSYLNGREGNVPKQAEAIQACKDAIGGTRRQVMAAYQQIPTNLKFKQGKPS
jgi:hypothetical protein